MLEGTPSKVLPKVVEPRKLAQLEAVFQGDIPIGELPRLSDAIVSADKVYAHLTFSIDEEGRKMLEGTVEGQAKIQCQRCMEAMDYTIKADVHLAVVWDEEQAKSLPKHIEPWVVPEPEAELYSILEEELLLALPIVAYHDYPCIDQSLLSAGEPEPDSSNEVENPFQILEKLKKD